MFHNQMLLLFLRNIPHNNKLDDKLELLKRIDGKNVDNLKCRREIMEIRDKYSKYLLPEFGILLVLSIIVLFLG